jgi:hypothetical protein
MLIGIIKSIVRHFHVEHAYNGVVIVIVVWFWLWVVVQLMQAVAEMIRSKKGPR